MTSLIVKSANPQGKGTVPVLESLQQAKLQLIAPAKNIHQVSSELFTSLMVLNSQIRFKPTANQSYWLYLKNDQYRLSLIAPEQWSSCPIRALYRRLRIAVRFDLDLGVVRRLRQ